MSSDDCELAFFGKCVRAFSEPLHVGRPNIPDLDSVMSRVRDVFERRWLTNDGPMVREFESRIAQLTGVSHCVAMCNATIALEIATRAAGLTGEVIVPSFTFIATAHALQWQQITPVFCDIDPATHNIDPAKIESMITPRTTGIIGTHVWGRPCDTEAIESIARRRGLTLMFDAAHAIGCSHRGRMVGSFGSAEVFSFHATKCINSVEGGAVVTNDGELAGRMRLMRNFGFAGLDRVDYIGTNGKMNELCATVGIASLDCMDAIFDANRRNYEAYREGLEDVPGLNIIKHDEGERCNRQYVVVEVDSDVASLSRDQLIAVLHAENVLARRYFWPGCHRMEPYRSLFPHAPLMLKETERLVERVLLLPTGTAVSVEDVSVICDVIHRAIGQAPDVLKRLASGES